MFESLVKKGDIIDVTIDKDNCITVEVAVVRAQSIEGRIQNKGQHNHNKITNIPWSLMFTVEISEADVVKFEALVQTNAVQTFIISQELTQIIKEMGTIQGDNGAKISDAYTIEFISERDAIDFNGVMTFKNMSNPDVVFAAFIEVANFYPIRSGNSKTFIMDMSQESLEKANEELSI